MVVHIQTALMLAGSGVSSDNGIDYGGKVGEDDGISPEVKQSINLWDIEW